MSGIRGKMLHELREGVRPLTGGNTRLCVFKTTGSFVGCSFDFDCGEVMFRSYAGSLPPGEPATCV